MRSFFLFIYFVLSIENFALAQNLVPNSSFEITSTCNFVGGNLFPTFPWFSPTSATPDYFNTCALDSTLSIPLNSYGYQNAHSGNGYTGILVYAISAIPPFTTYREYLQVELSSVLTKNKNYYVEFFVNLSNWDSVSIVAIKKIGLLFSDSLILQSNVENINREPQIVSAPMLFLTDTSNWIKVYGVFKSSGSEKYCTIGNFNNNQNTDTLFVQKSLNTLSPIFSYYYVDDVAIYEIKEPEAIRDTIICLGDSIIIGNNDSSTTCTWFPKNGLNNSTFSNPVAKPIHSTKYYVTHQNSFGYLAIDSVAISVIDCRNESYITFPNIFTPNNDNVNDLFVANSKNIVTFNCKIFNCYGIEIMEFEKVYDFWDGHTTSGEVVANGVFFFVATATGIDDKEFKLKGFVTLLR